jgi:putative membrane protein
MDQIEEGAKALSEGTALYSENYNTFNNAIGMLNDGTTTLQENYVLFNTGLQSANEGAKQVNDGMQQLNNAAESIKDVVYTVIDWLQTAMNTLVTPLKALEQTIIEDIDAVIAMVDNISTPSQENIDYINGLNYQAIQELYTENANLEALKEGADEETIAFLDEQIATNNNVIALLEQNNAETVYQNVDPEQVAQVRAKLVEIRGKVENSELTVEELEAKVQNIINQVYAAFDGINALAQGTEQLANGTEQLAEASIQINDGIATLSSSTEQLKAASIQLNDASIQISDGAKQLYDGISRFNNEGIKVLTSKVNNDVRGITARLDKLIELSEEYNNFSQIDSQAHGDLRFIMISDAIKLK